MAEPETPERDRAAMERFAIVMAGGFGTRFWPASRAVRPETGYGYLEIGELVSEGVHRVSAFIEKPDLERAQSFARSGRHLWNSGMFLFRADVILGEIERHLPGLHAFVEECDQAAARHE